jgi:hypothetical protein
MHVCVDININYLQLRRKVDKAACRDYLARTFPDEGVLRGPLQ